MSRARKAVLAVSAALAVAIAALVVVLLVHKPAVPRQQSAWQQVMSSIGPEGTVDLALAKTAFSVAYAPLPGARIPSGAPGAGHSGTAAANWILSHWNELTPPEQKTVAGALGLEPDSSVHNGLRLAAAQAPRFDGKTCGSRDDTPLSPATEEITAAIPGIRANLEKLLGVTLNASVLVCQGGTQIRTDKNAEVFADMLSQFEPNGDFFCRMTVFPLGLKQTGSERLQILVHEMMHCFNRRMADRSRVDANGFVFIPPWLDEGLCNWAAYQLAGPSTALIDWSFIYEVDPYKSLLERSYENMMFYQHLDNVHGHMWQLIPRAVGAAGDSYSRSAFAALLSEQRVDVLDTLPSSWVEDPTRGRRVGNAPPWDIEAPGLIQTIPPFKTRELVSDGAPVEASAAPYTSDLYKIDLKAEVVSLSTDASFAYGRFGPATDRDYPLGEAVNRFFCAKQGGCKCPEGTMTDIEFTDIDAGLAYLAVTGGDGEARAAAHGYSLDRFCKENRRRPRLTDPSLPASGCEGNCGGSNGDPHLVTFDQRYYDMQAVGEFVLAAAPGFEIQTRTAPIFKSRYASMNSALAMNVAGDRVGFTVSPEGRLAMRVNGSISAPGKLPHGGSVAEASLAFGRISIVTWPDGAQAWIRPTVAGYGLVINISLPPTLKGKLAGLLGNYNGDKTDDLVLRDGRPFPTAPTFQDMYPTFVDSWRVTQAESLFDYAPGQSTSDYTDLAFPENPTPVGDRATAEKECSAAGITEPVLFQNCVFDIMATGDRGFARDGAEIQRFLTSHGSSGSGTLLTGTLTDTDFRSSHVIDVGDSTVIYLQDAPGSTLSVCDTLISLEGAPARPVATLPCSGLRELGLREKSPTGRIVLHVDSLGRHGTYSFRLVVAQLHNLSVKPGTLVTGHIAPGQADVYYLDATSPVALSGLPAECGTLVWQHVDANDPAGTGQSPFGWLDEQGPLCNQGRRLFVTNPDPRTRFVLVIRGQDPSASGDYTFRLD